MPAQPSTASPTASAQPGKRLVKRQPWTVEDLRALLEGELSPEQIATRMRAIDPRGLPPVTFAALQSALLTDAVLSLMSEAQPEGPSKTDQLIELIQDLTALTRTVAEAQGQTNALLEEMLAIARG